MRLDECRECAVRVHPRSHACTGAVDQNDRIAGPHLAIRTVEELSSRHRPLDSLEEAGLSLKRARRSKATA